MLGIGRASSRSTLKIGHGTIDVTVRDDVEGVIANWKPTDIYYLAAVHGPSEDKVDESEAMLFSRSLGIHATGAINFLDVLRTT